MPKQLLSDYPDYDYSVLNTRLFLSCWLTFSLDSSVTSMRGLFRKLNLGGKQVDQSTFSKANQHRSSQTFETLYQSLNRLVKKKGVAELRYGDWLLNLYNLSEIWDSDLQIELFIPHISNARKRISRLKTGISVQLTPLRLPSRVKFSEHLTTIKSNYLMRWANPKAVANLVWLILGQPITTSSPPQWPTPCPKSKWPSWIEALPSFRILQH